MNLIEFKNVSKSYGTFQALKNINLQIEPGKIYGLLGPNGSGKTTIIKLINDLLTPTEGSILIKGQKPGVDSKKIISYLPERTYLNTNSKVSEIISLFEDFYEDFNKDKALKLLNDLNIDKDAKLKTMSKGTKEKVQLILVMSREADLYVLDEPIGGVDPAGRDYILNTILQNFKQTSSIIISTHLISDIEKILDDVIFIDKGKIILTSSADDLRKKENKFLLILAIIFTGLILIVTTLVFLIPRITAVKDIKVPDVTGLSVEDAESKLISAGFTISDEQKSESSSTIKEGNVTKTYPSKGSTRKKGASVTIYISSGENAYTLEDLTGKNYIEEKAVLEKMYNLFVKVEKIEDKGNHTSEEILKTEPAAGAKLVEGDTIILYISDMSTTYPDFTKGTYSLKQIEEWCTKYGVKLTTSYVETDEYPAGTIFEQSQKADDAVVNGQTLTIKIAEEVVDSGVDDIE